VLVVELCDVVEELDDEEVIVQTGVSKEPVYWGFSLHTRNELTCQYEDA
jgi:hypothetical protein